ncbi:hypothetical protein V6N13_088379 [Hibiscus sabdariffa]
MATLRARGEETNICSWVKQLYLCDSLWRRLCDVTKDERVSNVALSTASVRPLKTDHDCIAMMNSLPDNKYIHIYETKEADVNEEVAEVNVAEAEVNEDEIHVDANEEDVTAATEEEKGDDIAASEEEGDDAATEEEVNVATIEEEEEEDFKAVEEFDVSDHEYDWVGDEECRQKDGIGFRVQRNMDGFGPYGVNVNEKNKEPESETDNSEDLYSDHGLDLYRPRYPEFNSDMDMEKPKFVKGLVFSNRTVLKEAIKQYGRVERVEIKLKKNDKRRLQAVCKEGCPWKLWAAPLNPKDSMNQTWQIKTMVNSHNFFIIKS